MAEPESRRPKGGSEPTREQIEELAYKRYVERGGEGGRELEDWLEAERELRESEGSKADGPKAGRRKGGRSGAA
jgi:hypothetical protein